MHERKYKNFSLFFVFKTFERKKMKEWDKIFPVACLPAIDRYTIEHEPVSSLDLMERAAGKWVEKAVEIFPAGVEIMVIAGGGNNGGDGFAIARLLQERGRTVVVCQPAGVRMSADCEANRNRWAGPLLKVKEAGEIRPSEDAWIVDALFGTGLNRKVEGLAVAMIRRMNSLPNPVIAVDMPSGLMGEDNSENDKDAIVKAAYTLTFQFPKIAFMLAENEAYVGKWEVLDIGLHPDAIKATQTDFYYPAPAQIASLLPASRRFAHKGMNGHGLLIAGSYGMMGAAVLAAKAAVRSGIGLLTCHVPEKGIGILQATVPEALIEADLSEACFTSFGELSAYTAIGVGPAIGKSGLTVEALRKLLTAWRGKLVLDADALNILSENRDLLELLHPDCILTPHPKEFERLAGKSQNDFERLNNLSIFASHYRVTVILKGAHTVIAGPDGKCCFNRTGNPGMAKGGMGDVLTGVLLALLASGLDNEEAALTGVFAHGLAGDAVAAEYGMRGTCASMVAEKMGEAWKKLEQ